MTTTAEELRDWVDKEGSLNLKGNIGGLIAYVFPPISSLIVFLLEKENPYIRFHAAQGLVLFGGLTILYIAVSILLTLFGLVPVIGTIFSVIVGILFSLLGTLLGLVLFILWIYLMYQAFSGEPLELPVVGRYAWVLMGKQ